MGYRVVAGVDEAGRGPLAGPVVAAAVVFADAEAAASEPLLNDSKKLSPRQRERVYAHVIAAALSYGVARVDPDEIDRINILQASLAAMARAAATLDPLPNCVLVDGNHSPARHFPDPRPHIEPIVKGDGRCLSIAAASVIAKVTRDRLMVEYDAEYPEYGFAGHKGYPAQSHRDAIAEHGPCPIHRRSFRGVREHCE
ncbi:ribonuclease HII [Candidatus Poribacteria bacterium]|nr:ribonuclease HII [Candidatus Poribacteria bacterium]